MIQAESFSNGRVISLNPFVEEEDKEVYDLIPSLPLS